MRNHSASSLCLLTALTLVLVACGGTVLPPPELVPARDGSGAPTAPPLADGASDGSVAPGGHAGLPVRSQLPDDGLRPAPQGGSDGASADAGTPTDAGSTADAGTAADPVPTPAPAANPSFGCWAWGAPDVTAVAHAGFKWFESGYPGTLPASDNAYLTQHGTTPFAYINMAEVPNDDSYLQGQIGSFWSSIALCQNSGWNTTVVDVRDPRWQDWLERRANAAYAVGNRGIKWDVAAVENLCGGWPGQGSAASQQAVDAMATVLADLKAQHPDFKFIVNQGFALAEQHPELVDGFELENMINYADAHPGDAWSSDTIARVSAIHTNGHIPILNLEYYDDFGCSDTSCARAQQLYDEVLALDWVPYITAVHMNVEGRGLGIAPPW